jgi:hypothetical protein
MRKQSRNASHDATPENFVGTNRGHQRRSLALTASLWGALTASAWSVAVQAEIGPLTAYERANAAFELRVEAAIANRNLPLPPHPDNGDDARYSDRINSYTKGLPHDALGVVSPAAYDALLHALSTGNNADFENIPMGATNGNKLRDPQAAYTYSLEGRDAWSFTMPPAPAFSSAAQAAEALEVMWQALTRDVPFSQYTSNDAIKQAAADLSRFAAFDGPRIGGQVKPESLFRGVGVGELTGPYVSQFMLKPVPFGAMTVEQKFKVPVAGNDHLTNYAEWLAIQNGAKPSGITSEQLDGTARYIRNNRDLAQYVLKDFIIQGYMNAAQILRGFGDGALSDTFPYGAASKTQTRDPMWGVNQALDLLARVATPSQNVAWYQKWLVHRRARPEVFFGRVHNHLTNAASYPIHPKLFTSPALSAAFTANGTYLLPTATPAGSPLHPSYPAGHAVMAGAATTILKAFFKGSFPIPAPVVASDDGLSLLSYSGTLTVEGELNKLASNITLGRDAAGVHYRSDGDLGIRLGEKLGISVLRDLVNTYTDEFPGFSFNRFDGTPVTITKN